MINVCLLINEPSQLANEWLRILLRNPCPSFAAGCRAAQNLVRLARKATAIVNQLATTAVQGQQATTVPQHECSALAPWHLESTVVQGAPVGITRLLEHHRRLPQLGIAGVLQAQRDAAAPAEADHLAHENQQLVV